MSAVEPTLKTYYIVYGLLMVGLAATVGVAYLPLGAWNLAVAMTIAFAKASLVVLIFMHVRYSSKLTRLAVVAGLFWLAILLVFAIGDYATRDWIPARAPAQMELPA